jgi:hypothetical protein
MAQDNNSIENKNHPTSQDDDFLKEDLLTRQMFVWLCAIALLAIALIIDHNSPLMALLFAACGLVFACYGIISFFKNPKS